MRKNDTIIMKVGERDPNSWTEKYLRQMYADCPFDMNLLAANEKKIPAHSFVLMMFSAHLRKKFQTEIVFERGMNVPFTEYSYEVLSELVKILYFGEAAIRLQVFSQFNKMLQHLEIACPCCMPIKSYNQLGEESDGEGWEQKCDDPNVALMHDKQKMCHECITPGCPAKVATKVVDGKVMIKYTNPNHSSECVKINDEKYGKSKAVESVNRKRPKPKRTSAKKKHSDSEGCLKSSGDDVPKKQMKTADDKPSAKSVANIESKSIDTKEAESDGAPAMDKEQVGKTRCYTWDCSGNSDSSLYSTDSSSDDAN